MLYIYHTNDVHSQLHSWEQTVAFLKAKKQEHEANGDTVLIFDIGDFCDRAHPLTEATHATFNIALLKQAPYDAITIGNNEGISFPKTILNHLYDDVPFIPLLANITDSHTGALPNHFKAYHIFTIENVRIAVIGLTAPLYFSYLPNGWQPHEAIEVLTDLLPKLTNKCDRIVILSHLGLPTDQRLAEQFTQIDVIIGGHTHHILEKGAVVNQSLLLAAGKYGQYIGCLQWQVTSNEKQASLIETKQLPMVDSNATHDLKKGAKLLKKRLIGQIPEQMTQETFVLEAICQFAQTDIGFINSGLLLGQLPSGTITAYDLHQYLPHGIKVIRCQFLGKDLRQLLLNEIEAQRDDLQYKAVTGMGSRGKYFGAIYYKNIAIINNTIYIKNQPLVDTQVYTLATVDHLQYLPFFPSIEQTGNTQVLAPHLLREVVAIYIKEGETMQLKGHVTEVLDNLPQEERKIQDIPEAVVTVTADNRVMINQQVYDLIENYREAFRVEALEDRYTQLLQKYDYIVGDWGHEQLRLRGFYKNDTPKVPEDTKIATLEDYLREYCSFGCAYFVLQLDGTPIPYKEEPLPKAIRASKRHDNRRKQNQKDKDKNQTDNKRKKANKKPAFAIKKSKKTADTDVKNKKENVKAVKEKPFTIRKMNKGKEAN